MGPSRGASLAQPACGGSGAVGGFFGVCWDQPPGVRPSVVCFGFSAGPPVARGPSVSLGSGADGVSRRAYSAWCFTTGGCSTRSTSSWRAGAGTGPGTGSWTSVGPQPPPCNVPSRSRAAGRGRFLRALSGPCAKRGSFSCRYPHVRGHHRPASKPNAAQHGGVSVGPFQENVRLYPGKEEMGKDNLWGQN